VQVILVNYVGLLSINVQQLGWGKNAPYFSAIRWK